MEFEKVCNSIAEVLNVDPAEIRPETTFQEDLGADSLDIYQIVMKIEEEFEIRINEKDVENIRTVAEAMELITGRCG
ncbi:MAG: acyl carrier protein [Lachnospiraceae bacterium]|jgi:acyl carrier protein|nr:acyl carrier protein [Lachnospiraceae bacterium]